MTTIEEKIQEATTGEKIIQAEKKADTFTLNKEDSELLENIWKNNSRWKGVYRPYSAEEVLKLRGTLSISHTYAQTGAEKLWELLQS